MPGAMLKDRREARVAAPKKRIAWFAIGFSLFLAISNGSKAFVLVVVGLTTAVKLLAPVNKRAAANEKGMAFIFTGIAIESAAWCY